MRAAAPIQRIDTARLAAEPLGPRHFEQIRRLHRDPRVMITLSSDGRLVPDDRTRARLAAAERHWEEHGFGLWAFFDRAGGGFVGRAGLRVCETEGRREVELAYALVPESWNRGLATEMGAASLCVGFEQLGIPEVAAWTLPVNRASRRVMEKLGFAFEREFEYAGLPHLCYRLPAARFTPPAGARPRLEAPAAGRPMEGALP